MELSKDDTKMIQGLAVLAMVCLHLFDRYDFSGMYHPILYLGNYPLCFYFAQLSDWCVMGFAFCSGYSHFVMASTMMPKDYKRRSLIRLLSLYCNYWIVLAIVVLVSAITGQAKSMLGSPMEFIGNFSSIICTYNISWWYLLTYVIIVFLSPFLLEKTKKYNSFALILVFLAIYCIGYYLRFPLGENWIVEKSGKLCMTLFEYMLGIIFAKERLFSKIHSYSKRIPVWLCYVGIGIVLVVLLLGHTLISGNIIFAPVNGMFIIIAFILWNKPVGIKKLFLLMGKHSTNIWLTHLFLYTSLFENFVFVVKYPLFIYCLTIMLTVLISIVIEQLMLPIRSVVGRLK